MTEEKLMFCKTRDVKSPVRAHEFDAGFDWFVPNDLTLDEMREKESITGSKLEYSVNEDGYVSSMTLKPGQSVLIPSGIKVDVPMGYALIFENKSGIATKKSLLVGANTVDIGYMGICHMNMHNVGEYPVTISAGDKIVQTILFKIGFHVPTEVKDETELYDGKTTARATGGFGSSGTK